MSSQVSAPNLPLQSDVVVIGATIAGLTLAGLLSRHGMNVTVLEPGELSIGPGPGLVSMVRANAWQEYGLHYGTQALITHLGYRSEARQHIENLATTHALDFQLAAGIDLCFDGHLAFLLRQETEALRLAAITVQHWDRQPFTTPVRPGIEVQDQLRIDQPSYGDALLRHTIEQGAVVLKQVVPIAFKPRKLLIDTVHGEAVIKASWIVDTLGFAGYVGHRLRDDPANQAIISSAPFLCCGPLPSFSNENNSIITLVDSPASIVDTTPNYTKIYGQPCHPTELSTAIDTLCEWAENTLDLHSWTAQSMVIETSQRHQPIVGQPSRQHPWLWTVRGFGHWELHDATAAAFQIYDAILFNRPLFLKPALSAELRAFISRRYGTLAEPMINVGRELRRRAQASTRADSN